MSDLDLDKPYLWRVLKRDERADAVFVGPIWCELGSVPSQFSFSPPSAQEIGDTLDGITAGEYMLIHDERVEFVVLEATFRYADKPEEVTA